MAATGSSNTWSRTFTSSSTSDRPSGGSRRRIGGAQRLTALIRLVHPFPVLVDAVATAAIALVAGAVPATALRLGVAMLGLQAAIGALNDVRDAPRDAGLKPGKPIPAGLISPRLGLLVATAGATAGVLLSAPSGGPTLLLAVLILGIGVIYDLALKGTAWSWLPFAVGIPLLPVFAWLGSGSPLPDGFMLLLPAAFLAGAALAIGNALADVERDRAAGVTSIAARLGRARAWRVMAALYGAVVTIAAIGGPGKVPSGLTIAATVVPAVILAGAVALAASPSPERRERGWELQAVGVALLAAGWLAVTLR